MFIMPPITFEKKWFDRVIPLRFKINYWLLQKLGLFGFGLFAFALICALAMGLVRNRLIKAAIGIIAFIAVTIFDNIDLKTGKPKEGGALDISNPLNPN